MLKSRSNANLLYNTLTDRVGTVILQNPGKDLTVKEIHALVIEKYPERGYTVGQVRTALEWQSANNAGFISHWLVPDSRQKYTRMYRYDDAGKSA